VSWIHPLTEACLARCAQPRSGLLRTRCPEDEEFVRSLANAEQQQSGGSAGSSTSNKLVVHLVDARPVANAVANALKGGGTERAVHYAHQDVEVKLHFLNIGNIHVVRESYERLLNLCRIAGASATLSATAHFHFSNKVQFGTNKKLLKAKHLKAIDDQIVHGVSSHSEWLSRVQDTGWLAMVSTVLRGSTLINDLLHSRRESVLTHCSDGWDRTAQLCSLVQVQLDPFCRTIIGFEQLLEREWLAFGHRFDHRLGRWSRRSDHHALTAAAQLGTQSPKSPAPKSAQGEPVDRGESSPIFLVFLDCVWQLQQQFPSHFQFNERFLLEIAEHAHSGRFGTFLGNCDFEREVLSVESRTESLWTHLNSQMEQYVNPRFRNHTGDEVFLRPETSMRCMRLWEGYWLRDDPATRKVRERHDTLINHEVSKTEELHALRNEVANLRLRLDRVDDHVAKPVRETDVSEEGSTKSDEK
jgi:myotubularin-related protein 1/2